MKWECTCETCPMFERMETPKDAPPDFDIGACWGSPGVIQLTPLPPQRAEKRVIDSPQHANAQMVALMPVTYERQVRASRRACAIHPEWHYRVLTETAAKLQQDATAAFLLAVPPEGHS